MAKSIEKMNDAELEERAQKLGAERTALREEQVAVQAEIDLRAALRSMPASARVALEGRLAPSGDPSAERSGS